VISEGLETSKDGTDEYYIQTDPRDRIVAEQYIDPRCPRLEGESRCDSCMQPEFWVHVKEEQQRRLRVALHHRMDLRIAARIAYKYKKVAEAVRHEEP
jgi:hypothetical protein